MLLPQFDGVDVAVGVAGPPGVGDGDGVCVGGPIGVTVGVGVGVVVGPPPPLQPHSAGHACCAGTAAAATQSTLYSVTQSTQSIVLPVVRVNPAFAALAGRLEFKGHDYYSTDGNPGFNALW